MNAFGLIAENKIRDAIARGELDNLPHHGIPIDITDDFSLPAELRFALRKMMLTGALKDEQSPLARRWALLKCRKLISVKKG